MSVVKFEKPKPETMIWVCVCGCASFELHANGDAVCRGCQLPTSDQDGLWWDTIKTQNAETETGPSFFDSGNGDNFAEHLAKRNVKDAEWLIWGKTSGQVTAWSRDYFETPEHEEWFRSRAAIGVDLIMKESKP